MFLKGETCYFCIIMCLEVFNVFSSEKCNILLKWILKPFELGSFVQKGKKLQRFREVRYIHKIFQWLVSPPLLQKHEERGVWDENKSWNLFSMSKIFPFLQIEISFWVLLNFWTKTPKLRWEKRIFYDFLILMFVLGTIQSGQMFPQ